MATKPHQDGRVVREVVRDDALSVDEIDSRTRAVAEAVHSSQMEGLDIDDEARADLGEFILGRLSLEQVRERACSRYEV